HVLNPIIERRPVPLHSELRVRRAKLGMLRQHSFELRKAARVLVLELDTGGSIGISLGKGRHFCCLDEIGDRASFLAETAGGFPLGAVAASAYTERECAIGKLESKLEHGEPTHR